MHAETDGDGVGKLRLSFPVVLAVAAAIVAAAEVVITTIAAAVGVGSLQQDSHYEQSPCHGLMWANFALKFPSLSVSNSIQTVQQTGAMCHGSGGL